MLKKCWMLAMGLTVRDERAMASTAKRPQGLLRGHLAHGSSSSGFMGIRTSAVALELPTSTVAFEI